METIIPGLKLVSREGEIMCCKNGKTYPFRYESTGTRRIIAVLAFIIALMNDPSLTVVIDELDSGIHEFLLGELLSSLEKEGAGQLIFTAHNLRPLEVLKKTSIVFTTGNETEPYIRMKGLGKTNNLRDVYLKEIQNGSDEPALFPPFQRERFISACKSVNLQAEITE